MSGRTLDYCGIRAICGKDAADCLFGRRLPEGFDMDQPGDEEAITTIVREASRCDKCPERAGCDPIK